MLRTHATRSPWAESPAMPLLVLAASVFLGVRESSATPLYFTGPWNFGTVQAEVTDAQTADPSLDVLDIDNPIPGLGMVSLSLAGATGSPNPNCADAPLDPTCLDLRAQIPESLPVDLGASPLTKADPTTAVSTWTVTNTSGLSLASSFLVFVSSPGAVHNDPELVGLEPVTADGYTVINFSDVMFGEIFYAAVELGPLGPGATTTAKVHYVVADDLIPTGTPGYYELPLLNVQAIAVPVPEPDALSLFTLGLIGLAVLRRHRCD